MVIERRIEGFVWFPNGAKCVEQSGHQTPDLSSGNSQERTARNVLLLKDRHVIFAVVSHAHKKTAGSREFIVPSAGNLSC